MNRRRLGALLATAVLSGALLTPTPADADVPITQVASLVGQQPVSGTWNMSYTNYGEKVCVNPRGCSITYYRVARGTFKNRLNTYRLEEELDDFDFYILDVNTTLTGQSGTATLGGAQIRVQTLLRKSKLADTDDSRALTKDPEKCQSFPVSVGAGLGWGGVDVGGSIEVGTIRFCDKSASVKVRHLDGDAIYTADRIPKIRQLNVGRIVKVKAGAKPRFLVSITLPADVCTKVGTGEHSGVQGKCIRHSNATTTQSLHIGTRG